MPIDLSSTAKSEAGVTKTGTTLSGGSEGDWTLVTFPDWCRVAEISNQSGEDLSLKQPAEDEAATYSATDAFQIPSTVLIYALDLSQGRAKPTVKTVSVRTATSQTLSFRMLP